MSFRLWSRMVGRAPKLRVIRLSAGQEGKLLAEMLQSVSRRPFKRTMGCNERMSRSPPKGRCCSGACWQRRRAAGRRGWSDPRLLGFPVVLRVPNADQECLKNILDAINNNRLQFVSPTACPVVY